MHKQIFGLIVGVSFLCTQAVASEMVRYEPGLYLAKSEGSDTHTDAAKKKVEKKADKSEKAAKTETKATKKAPAGKKHDADKTHHHHAKHSHHKDHDHKHHEKKHHKHHKHHAKDKCHMTKPGMERYIDKIAPEHD